MAQTAAYGGAGIDCIKREQVNVGKSEKLLLVR
jgi:hypothetical protein